MTRGELGDHDRASAPRHHRQVLPSWLGLPTTSAEFSFAAITASVLVFLGIPLAAGYLSRRIGEATRGRDWYETTFLPRVGPFALWGLLFTIVMLFALQGQQVIDNPLDVGRIALPLLAYFALTFFAGFLIATARPLGRPLTGLLLTTEWATSATDSVGDSVE